MTLTTLLETLAECPADRADAIALRSARGGALTFGELAAHIRRVSGALQRAGLRSGDRALYAIRPSPEAVALQLGVLRAGGVLGATNLGLGETAFDARIRTLAPRWVLTEPLLLALSRSRLALALLRRRGIVLPRLAAIPDATFVTVGRWVPGSPRALSFASLRGDDDAVADAHAHAARSLAETLPEDDAFIVFTSGTTGEPKGVVHTRASVAAMFDIVARHLDAGPGSVVLASALHLVVPALLQSATVLIPPHGSFDPERLLDTLERERVTHVFGVPQEWQQVVEFCQRTRRTVPASLRLLMLGSAPVRRPFLERLRDVIAPGTVVRAIYGMSEAAPVASVTLEEKLAYTGSGDLLGSLFPEVRARIAEDGELFIGGTHLFRGYLGGAPVTEHATGDLGMIDEHGRLVLLGRQKDMIIRGHHNLYPELYEPLIEAITGVRRCALVGVYDERIADELVVLAVEPEPGLEPVAFEQRIRREIHDGAGRIDAAAQPDHVLVMTLPLSGRSSKIDRNAVRDLARSHVCA